MEKYIFFTDANLLRRMSISPTPTGSDDANVQWGPWDLNFQRLLYITLDSLEDHHFFLKMGTFPSFLSWF